MSYLIVAYDENHGIGLNNTLPWYKTTFGRADMTHFREMTTGHAVIMGHNTYCSIGGALPGRINLVVSRNHLTQQYPDVSLYGSLDEAVRVGRKLEETEKIKCFVIGGQQIYEEYMKWYTPTEIHITVIPDDYNCDCQFPTKYLPEESSQNYTLERRKGEYGEVYLTYRHNLQGEHAYLDIFRQVLSVGHAKSDRTGVGTVSLFSPPELTFSLRDGVIPILTTKQVAVKTCLTELLWFISGSVDTKVLEGQGCHIWRGNTSRDFLDSRGLEKYREGELGPGYGFQWRHAGASYQGPDADYSQQGVDQLAALIRTLREDPDSRRIMMSSWSASQIDEMALPPCHVLYQLYSYLNPEDNRRYLSAKMYQRSADSFLGVPFNILSYAALTHMIAHVVGMVPDKIVFTYGDYHVYHTHKSQVAKQLLRYPRPFPKIRFAREVAEIDDFVLSDIEIVGYNAHPKIEASMAV